MQKRKLIILALVIGATGFLFQQCKEDLTVTFGLDYVTYFTLPATPIGQLLQLVIPEVETNFEQSFQNQNTNADRVQELKINKFNLVIEEPQTQTFSFLNDIQVYLAAEGLPEVEIANRFNIPDDVGKLLQLDPVNVDLSEYAKKEQLNLRVKATVDELYSQDVDVRADYTFSVKAQIFE